MTDLPDPIPGSWLAAALDETGLLQADLAEELGHSDRSQVYRWVHGKPSKPSGPVGLTRMQWLACLSALDLPKDWRPPAERKRK